MKANILDRIAATKRAEVEALKQIMPLETLSELSRAVRRPPLSLKDSVRSRETAVIAEHKRRSPSKGEISPMSQVAEIAETYAVNGAAGMSVLTDTAYFGGSLADLALARRTAPWLPLLRKEFMVDEYQLYEARVYGADAVLLIAAMLDADSLGRLNDTAHALGLQTLVELHSEKELEKLPSDADLVGVNNRDLTTFSTDISVASGLIGRIPADTVKIAESGIRNPSDLRRLKDAGFDGFLIGEALMSAPAPGIALQEFLAAGL